MTRGRGLNGARTPQARHGPAPDQGGTVEESARRALCAEPLCAPPHAHRRADRVAPAEREPCTALVEPSHAQGYGQILPRTGHAWQQMKQCKNYLSFLVTSTTQKAAVLACPLLSIFPGEMGPACHPNASPHTQEEIAYGKRIRASLPGPTPRLGYAHGLLASARFPGRDLVAGSGSLTSYTGPGRTPGGAPL